jgi:hypothetical protein
MIRRASGIARSASRARDRANRIGIALHIGERVGRTPSRAPNRAHGVDHHFSPWFPPCPTPRLAGDDRLAAIVDLDVLHDDGLFPAVSHFRKDEQRLLIGLH